MLFIIFCIALLVENSYMTTTENFSGLGGTNAIAAHLIFLQFSSIRSTIECARMCVYNDPCWSFGYHSNEGICQLISSVLTETIVTGTDFGWTYFVRTDHCISPWRYFGSSCYYVKQDTVSFDDAQSQCSSLQSHLIKIDDVEENTFAKNIVKDEGLRHHWIGLSDADQEGNWRWRPSLEGTTYTDWAQNEPDGGNSENCAVIYTAGLVWHDYNCNTQFSFICEKEF